MIEKINELIEKYQDELSFWKNPNNYLDGRGFMIRINKDILSDLEELKKLREKELEELYLKQHNKLVNDVKLDEH